MNWRWHLTNLHYTPRYKLAEALVWLAHRICWVGAANRAEIEDFNEFGSERGGDTRKETLAHWATADELAHLRIAVRQALESDSNDEEHDALVYAAEIIGVSYEAPDA
jgi:hypothetical protein